MRRLRRQPYRVLCAAAMVTGLTACRCQPEQVRLPNQESPNIVLIVIDTLRADRLGTYGHNRNTSTNIDALATQAIVYERAYSQAPWTTPSIGSLLTGRYPSQLGIHKDRAALSKKEHLISEFLAKEGYATGAAISHSYCGSAWKFDQGFEYFDESNVLGHSAVTSAGVTDEALEFIDSVDTNAPFFLFAHYFDPHFAYVEHDAYPFGGGDAYTGPIKSDMKVQALRKQSRSLSETDVQELLRLYDSEIAYTDSEIGRLLKEIDAKKGLDNTMVVITADHGEEFLDHGRWGHTTRLYDEIIRVPLIIRYPDGRTGREDAPVGLTDIAPTILGAVNLEPYQHHVGVNLATHALDDHTVFSETSKGAQAVAVIRGDRKLIIDYKQDEKLLFNLKDDAFERTNTAQFEPKTVGELESVVTTWTNTIRRGKKKGAQVELTTDEIKQLEALGYVDP